MGEFFHGWRRKVGMMTLALALVFMAGWIRSFNEVDQIEYLKDTQTLHVVYSCPAGIGWTRLHEIRKEPKYTVGIGRFNCQTFHSKNHNGAYPFNWNDEPVGANWFGFRKFSVYLESGSSLEALKIWIVAYPTIVFPLTLLSGFLLFGKKCGKSKAMNLSAGKASEMNEIFWRTG